MASVSKSIFIVKRNELFVCADRKGSPGHTTEFKRPDTEEFIEHGPTRNSWWYLSLGNGTGIRPVLHCTLFCSFWVFKTCIFLIRVNLNVSSSNPHHPHLVAILILWAALLVLLRDYIRNSADKFALPQGSPTPLSSTNRAATAAVLVACCSHGGPANLFSTAG